MADIIFDKQELKEIEDVIISAIDDGYITNETTKRILYKLDVDVNILKNLDEYSNIGIKLVD